MEQGERPKPTDDETSSTPPVWLSMGKQHEANETPIARPEVGHRAGDAGNRPPETAAWIDALDREVTGALYGRLYKYARRYAAGLGRAGVPDHDHTRQIVHDAVDDIFLRRVAWEPTRCDLETRCKDVIRYRAKKAIQRAEKYPSVAIGLYADDDRSEAEAAAAIHDSRNTVVDRMIAEDRLARLRDSSAGDPEVLAVIDAFLAGACDPSELCEHTGLSREAYRRARQRMTYRLQQLDPPSPDDASGPRGSRP